jgi:hypothetical protein
MSDKELPDHDQRLKVLLKEFFEQFFLCFFADWADRFDFTDVTWIDKEVFLAPPQGEKRQLDLVSRVRLRPGVPPPQPDLTELVTLIHIEIESRDSVNHLRPRMFEYYTQLRRDFGLPVLPIGLFLRVGLNDIGWDSYDEFFWDQPVLHFEYAYVGLPALDAEKYVNGEHLLGVALSALMDIPEERRVELHAESLKRIAQSPDNDMRRFLLTECLEAYMNLDEAQRQELKALIETEPYREAKPFMITTFERGVQQGIQQGKVDATRENVLMMLSARFGKPLERVQKRVSELTMEQLKRLMIDLLKANSLEELDVLR